MQHIKLYAPDKTASLKIYTGPPLPSAELLDDNGAGSLAGRARSQGYRDGLAGRASRSALVADVLLVGEYDRGFREGRAAAAGLQLAAAEDDFHSRTSLYILSGMDF